MTTATANPRAFAVWFEDLDRWDPASFERIVWNWPKALMCPISTFLRPRKGKIDRNKYAFADLQPITIHFDGTIDRREIEAGREYTMELFAALPGDVIVAKIDLKNGAVAIVPDWENVAVTGHFAVYEPDRKAILPEYFLRVVQATFFKAHLWRNKVGAEGRKEVKLDFFEALEIPLPPLPVQRAIVRRWQDAQAEVDGARKALDTAVAALNDRLFALYRRQTKRDVVHSRCFVLDFKDLGEWDTKSSRAAAYRLACPSFRPMGEFIEEATELVRPFDDPEKDWPIYGVNNKEGVFFNAMQKGKDFNAPYKRIRKDWFFHNPTRSAVGSLGIVPDVPADAVTSPEYQVWRVKDTGKDRLLPGYVAVLLQTAFFIDVVQFYRVGAVKQRMYVDNLCQVRLPYLDESEQRQYAQARDKALVQIEKAKARADVAKTEVEEMILGRRPVKAGSP